jgi:hypothetical protein
MDRIEQAQANSREILEGSRAEREQRHVKGKSVVVKKYKGERELEKGLATMAPDGKPLA